MTHFVRGVPQLYREKILLIRVIDHSLSESEACQQHLIQPQELLQFEGVTSRLIRS
ncbi:hypothetical protein [Lapillicoccus jejuensis]|uniref:hypothetical protein n=1 Tax=Lapillicoccus jejuensis TaxID=402171 RepID=UPI00147747CF|nr:hypothetical protein [Lapillicoccus jejuensis]